VNCLNTFEDEGHDGVLASNEVNAAVDLVGPMPAMDRDPRLAASIEMDAQNLGVVEGWPMAKP